MRCEEVRSLLPEFAEDRPRLAGDVEVHLAGCAACRAELGGYRSLVAALGELREDLLEPSPGFLERVLGDVPPFRPGIVRRVTGDERVHHAMFSLGGAVVGATMGATAVALLRRRPWRQRDRS